MVKSAVIKLTRGSNEKYTFLLAAKIFCLSLIKLFSLSLAGHNKSINQLIAKKTIKKVNFKYKQKSPEKGEKRKKKEPQTKRHRSINLSSPSLSITSNPTSPLLLDPPQPLL